MHRFPFLSLPCRQSLSDTMISVPRREVCSGSGVLQASANTCERDWKSRSWVSDIDIDIGADKRWSLRLWG